MEGIRIDGTFKGARKVLNLISGTNVTITAVDSNSAANVIDITVSAAGASGAPSDADYLVGTANGSLSGEIVVGTSPGGELGGTWGSPTVDETHSGSSHAGVVSTHEAAADPHTGYLKESDFTGVDFLVGTATGITAAEIVVGTSPGGELGGTWASPTVDATHSGSTHTAATTTHEAAADPHTGYVLESLLNAKGDLISASADNTPSLVTVGADDTILMADSAQTAGLKWVASATPSTQAFGDAAAAGTGDTFTRGDHKHAMPAKSDIWTQTVDQSGTSFAAWTSIDGTWSSDGTVIKQTATTAGTFLDAYLTASQDTAFAIFQAQIQIKSATAGNAIGGMILGFDGTNLHGLSVRIDGTADQFLVDSESSTAHLTVSTTINVDTWYTVRLVGNNGCVAAYLDGTLQGSIRFLETSAPVIRDASKIGLYTYQSEVWFRNIKLYNLNYPA